MNKLPKVAVLLAAHNAKKWLQAQLETILMQQGVSLTVYISLDQSTDGSEVWLPALIANADYTNVELLSYGERFGSAAKNFYHLIKTVDFSNYDLVAFADQDDLWNPDKLTRVARLLTEHHAVGYSSNVTAFWPDGRSQTLKKDYPQTAFDYFFESAGPGCTYVIEVSQAQALKRLLEGSPHINTIDFHDWLIYAFIRHQNHQWIIDSYESMRYRQHADNVIGARSGLGALKRRFRQIKNGWYRAQVLHLFEVLAAQNHPLYPLIKANGFWVRLKLIPKVLRFRRKHSDALVLMVLILFNLW